MKRVSSSGRTPHVLILGGGISGMSAAMELCADHRVTILERRPMAGGKARTWVDPERKVFREHSFRVFHATYDNTYDTMKRVPIGGGRTVRDNLVGYTRPAELEATGEGMFRRWLEAYQGEQPIDARERLRLAGDAARLLGALCASERRLQKRYGEVSFEQLFTERPDGRRGALFAGLKDMSQVEYSADRVNPDVKVMVSFVEKHFMHGRPGLAWNALTGPTSDTYIEPWKKHLVERGVEFRHETEVTAVHYDRDRREVSAVSLRDLKSADTEQLSADAYVCCMPTPDLLRVLPDDLLDVAPSLRRLREVRRVWNNGAIIYNDRPVRYLGGYYMWHPWRTAVTTYAQRWRAPHGMGGYGVGHTRGKIGDIISYVITDWFAEGPATGKRAADCTPDEIYEELCFMCESDPSMMPEFNRAHHVFPEDAAGNTVRCMVDGSLIYGANGRIEHNEDTLAHLPPGYSFRMPGAQTEVANLMLATCAAYNAYACADNMEGANETGRRAANAVLAREDAPRRALVLEGRLRSPVGRAFEAARRIDEALSVRL